MSPASCISPRMCARRRSAGGEVAERIVGRRARAAARPGTPPRPATARRRACRSRSARRPPPPRRRCRSRRGSGTARGSRACRAPARSGRRRPPRAASRHSVRGCGSTRRASCMVSVEPPNAARPRTTSRPSARAMPTGSTPRVLPEAAILGGQRGVDQVRRDPIERHPGLAPAGRGRVLAQHRPLRRRARSATPPPAARAARAGTTRRAPRSTRRPAAASDHRRQRGSARRCALASRALHGSLLPHDEGQRRGPGGDLRLVHLARRDPRDDVGARGRRPRQVVNVAGPGGSSSMKTSTRSSRSSRAAGRHHASSRSRGSPYRVAARVVGLAAPPLVASLVFTASSPAGSGSSTARCLPQFSGDTRDPHAHHARRP